jgi:hypothetical protein
MDAVLAVALPVDMLRYSDISFPEPDSGQTSSETGISRKKSGVPEEKARVPEKKTGIPEKKAGVSEKKAGILEEKKAGVPEKKAGMPEDKTGIPEEKSTKRRKDRRTFGRAQSDRLGFFVMKKGETLVDLRKHILRRAREVYERRAWAAKLYHENNGGKNAPSPNKAGNESESESESMFFCANDHVDHRRDWGAWGFEGEGTQLLHGGFLFVLDEGTRIVEQDSEGGVCVCDVVGGVACVSDQRVVDFLQVCCHVCVCEREKERERDFWLVCVWVSLCVRLA